MAAPDNLHSRVVGWLKVILPLAALALLSTLFLVARTGDPNATLPYSQRDLQQMAREQKVDGPEFSGITPEGRAFFLSAATATPRDSSGTVVDAVRISGTIETGDDGAIAVTSEEGTVFAGDSRAQLRGNVRVVTSTGYRIDTDELTTALDRTEMETAGPVAAEGPLGRIDAGRMTVIETGNGGTDVSVVFKDGVKLIYVPQTQ